MAEGKAGGAADLFARQVQKFSRTQEKCKVMHESSKRVSETLQEIHSSEWDGHEELKAIGGNNGLLWEDCEEKLADQALRTMENSVARFGCQEDEAKIAKAGEEFNKAQLVFEDLNQELLEELPVLYNSSIDCYVTIFQNISNLKDVFYREMSKLSHNFQTSTASSPPTSPTSPSTLFLTSERDSISASEEEITLDPAQGEDNSEMKDELLKEKEIGKEEVEANSSEEEEPLPYCNGPTQAQPSSAQPTEAEPPCSRTSSPSSRATLEVSPDPQPPQKVRTPENKEKENTDNLNPDLCTFPTSVIPQVFSDSDKASKMGDKEGNNKLILSDPPENQGLQLYATSQHLSFKKWYLLFKVHSSEEQLPRPSHICTSPRPRGTLQLEGI
uniref:BAR domain-containing protein n=1 Tax=Pipistrellus kuhlii TaxID=59472 RepID=A0A7J7YLN9_PIPKU|nr:hypothetical protein mPipKuh1_001462 [Pipistrellus kuhlii]